MTHDPNSAAEYFERARHRTPAYLDLASAQTDEEFEAAFVRILEVAVQHLEKNKKNFQKLSEEELSAVLAGALMIPGLLTVTQESNSNGHVDLTIQADHSSPARIKLGEAKIYSSPSYHMKGIGQLLSRYTTGREAPGLLINYVRKKDITAITATLRKAMDEALPEKQTAPCEDYVLKWSLLTKHKHSSGEVVSVGHIGFNLHI